jgi:FKBP-type peptidyl-prolyl cis-trans isomerase 2
MVTVKEGDTIRINYVGKVEDGTVFDSTAGTHPLEFTVGEGELIPGLEKGVIGMKPGEFRSVSIPMGQGYGPRVEERVFEFDRKRLPDNIAPEIGRQMQMYRADGMPMMVTIVGISETSLTMDCNHPLAGKTLIFDTTLLEILNNG